MWMKFVDTTTAATGYLSWLSSTDWYKCTLDIPPLKLSPMTHWIAVVHQLINADSILTKIQISCITLIKQALWQLKESYFFLALKSWCYKHYAKLSNLARDDITGSSGTHIMEFLQIFLTFHLC